MFTKQTSEKSESKKVDRSKVIFAFIVSLLTDLHFLFDRLIYFFVTSINLIFIFLSSFVSIQ